MTLAALADAIARSMMFNTIFASIKLPRSERCHSFGKTSEINVAIIPNTSLLIIMNHEAVKLPAYTSDLYIIKTAINII